MTTDLKEIEKRINERLKEEFGEDWFYNEKLRFYDFLPIIYDELGIPYHQDPNVSYNFDPPPDYKEIEL